MKILKVSVSLKSEKLHATFNKDFCSPKLFLKRQSNVLLYRKQRGNPKNYLTTFYCCCLLTRSPKDSKGDQLRCQMAPRKSGKSTSVKTAPLRVREHRIYCVIFVPFCASIWLNHKILFFTKSPSFHTLFTKNYMKRKKISK